MNFLPCYKIGVYPLYINSLWYRSSTFRKRPKKMKDGNQSNQCLSAIAGSSFRKENNSYDDLAVISNGSNVLAAPSTGVSKCQDSPLKLHLSCNDNGAPLFVFPSNGRQESKIDDTNVLDVKKFPSAVLIKNIENRSCNKFANISLDCVQTKKEECPLISCPSLDSSLAINHNRSFLPLMNPTTTASPARRLTSLGSLDSGVLSSALSFDMAHISQENSKRSRITSSVSSGTCDMWQDSIDGDACAPEPESLVEISDATESPWPSFLKKSARSDNLNSCFNKLEQNNTQATSLTIVHNINIEKLGESDSSSEQIKPTESSLNNLMELDEFASKLVMVVISEALTQSVSMGWSIKCSGQCSQESCREDFKKQISSRKESKAKFSTLGLSSCNSSLCWTPEIPFSPSHRSKRSSISFSHDSLVSAGPVLDDSHLITGAVSHDALIFSTREASPSVKKKTKNCMECLNTEIYSMPIDTVTPYQGNILHPKVITRQPKRRSQTRSSKSSAADSSKRRNSKVKRIHKVDCQRTKTIPIESNLSESQFIPNVKSDQHQEIDDKIASEPSSRDDTICPEETEILIESKKVTPKVSRILPSFSSTKNCKRKEDRIERKKNRSLSSNIRNTLSTFFTFKKSHSKEIGSSVNAENEFTLVSSSRGCHETSDPVKWGKICPLPSAPALKNCSNGSAFTDRVPFPASQNPPETKNHSSQKQSNSSISPSSLLSCLGHPRTNSIDHDDRTYNQKSSPLSNTTTDSKSTAVKNRALPPLPSTLKDNSSNWNTLDKTSDEGCDFASIIEKVKNYGWYWGPISGESAEKVLSNEPDGSFIVRDSSDYHYIFSLTFRLNGVTRHVRIEHDQGNFSFGGFTRFKSQTIVDFIEKAVEHSRSGRYLFFLHRRPVLGPMRVQLLHPVSRFKHVQSLQHMCRFVIVKQVRKDLIPSLPLPKRLKDYLNSPHYYSEQVEQCMSTDIISSPKARQGSSCRLASSEESSTTHLFLNLRNSFPTSMDNRPLRCRNARLCSSQSSLETMQASALPERDPIWNKDAPFSSPSSPGPFDFSTTTDWISSSEDLFRFRKTTRLALPSPRQQRRSLNLGRSRNARKTKCLSTSSDEHFADICDNNRNDASSTINGKI